MKALNQKGSLHLGLILAVVVVAGVVFAGYRVWTNQHPASSDTVAQTTTVPAAIHTKADLVATGKALDAGSSQLNSSLDDSSLDSDINSML